MIPSTAKPIRSAIGATVAWLIAATAFAQPSTPASEYRVVCDETCLTQFAERFLDALANREPHRVPLAADVRFTENGAALAIGDGVWATASGLGPNRLIFTDPATLRITWNTLTTR